MTSDASRPATDADRDRVRAVLRELLGHGRIPLSDYQTRLRRVGAASTTGELDAIVGDLADRPGHERHHDAEGGAPPTGSAKPGERGPSMATLQRVLLVVVALGTLVWAFTYFLGR